MDGANSDHAHYITTGGISADHTHSFSTGGISANHNHGITVNASGSDGANKNIQPYITCYMWKRVA